VQTTPAQLVTAVSASDADVFSPVAVSVALSFSTLVGAYVTLTVQDFPPPRLFPVQPSETKVNPADPVASVRVTFSIPDAELPALVSVNVVDSAAPGAMLENAYAPLEVVGVQESPAGVGPARTTAARGPASGCAGSDRPPHAVIVSDETTAMAKQAQPTDLRTRIGDPRVQATKQRWIWFCYKVVTQ
jgi:hypothetical protein